MDNVTLIDERSGGEVHRRTLTDPSRIDTPRRSSMSSRLVRIRSGLLRRGRLAGGFLLVGGRGLGLARAGPTSACTGEPAARAEAGRDRRSRVPAGALRVRVRPASSTPAASRFGRDGLAHLLEVIGRDRPDRQVGLQGQGLGEVLGGASRRARPPRAGTWPGRTPSSPAAPGCVGIVKELVGRLQCVAADEALGRPSRARLLRSIADPGIDRSLQSVAVEQVVAQQEVDQPLTIGRDPGLGAEVGVVDRAEVEQVQRLVGLAGGCSRGRGAAA